MQHSNIIGAFLSLVSLPFILHASIEKRMCTDYAIFLFDPGETNYIASILAYATQHEKQQLDSLDFKIIYMGAACDSMAEPPFSLFSDKLIHIQEFGLQESIDRNGARNTFLSNASINRIKKMLTIKKTICTGCSIEVFAQIINAYPGINSIAIRDYPFIYNQEISSQKMSYEVACSVSSKATHVVVPSKLARDEMAHLDSKVCVIGHPQTEDFCTLQSHIAVANVMERMHLDPTQPIVMYAGSYGPSYKDDFTRFISFACQAQSLFMNIQLLILPHPRYQCKIEQDTIYPLEQAQIPARIVEHSESSSLQYMTTMEALSCADVLITQNPTSTMVLHANALNIPVIYLRDGPADSVAIMLEIKKLFYSTDSLTGLKSTIELLCNEKNSHQHTDSNVFANLGIPKHAAQTAWRLLISDAPSSIPPSLYRLVS